MTAFSATGKLGMPLPLWLSTSLSILCHSDTAWLLHEEPLRESTTEEPPRKARKELKNELKTDPKEEMHAPDPEGLGDLLKAVAAMQWSGEAPGFSPPPASHPLRTRPASIRNSNHYGAALERA